MIQCCECQRKYERGSETQFVEKIETAIKADIAPPVSKVSRDKEPMIRRNVKSVEKTVELENKTSTKLLQGWTMLAEHCPMCFSPIMKNPMDGSMWCVECNLQAVTEDEFDEKKHVKFDGKKSENVVPTTSVSKGNVMKKESTISNTGIVARENTDIAVSLRQTLLTKIAALNEKLENTPIEAVSQMSEICQQLQTLITTLEFSKKL